MRDIILLTSIFVNIIFAQEFVLSGQRVAVKRIVSGLSIVWGFDFLSEDVMVISQKNGKMYLFSKGNLEEITGHPSSSVFGQGGLMDVRVHPRDKRVLFFSYVSKYEEGYGTIIARAKLNGTKLENVKTLFRSSPPGQTGRHFGSRIVFKDETLFFGVGDRGERDKAQLLNYPNGKIFRLHLNGSLPEDNPFKAPNLLSVWSYGHRNPQGMAVHPETGKIWEQEHGPRGGDEINLIEKGKNYGWPIITYGREYWGPTIGTTHKEGMEQPIKYFVPSIAPSSLMIYSGKLFKDWKGHFFSSSLRFRYINKLVIKNGTVLREENILGELKQRIRHVSESPSGAIFFSTDSGNIYKLTPIVHSEGKRSKTHFFSEEISSNLALR